MKKSALKRKLSEVSDFENPKISLEQYRTPPALAADIIYTAYMQDDIEGKKVADLGTGTGILAAGAALLGGDVTAYDTDPDALEQAEENFEKLGVDVELVEKEIEEVNEEFDTVVMNPPFSMHSEIGLDFWKKATASASVVYGLSPTPVRERIKDFLGNSQYEISEVAGYRVGLPPSYGFHTEESHETHVDLVIARQKENGT